METATLVTPDSPAAAAVGAAIKSRMALSGYTMEDLAVAAIGAMDRRVLCLHEPYCGHCAHCDVPFRNGVPVRG